MNNSIKSVIIDTFGHASKIPSLFLKRCNGVIKKSIVDQILEELNISLVDLQIKLLPVAASYHITPISDFAVGAVVAGASGSLYFGSNIEFIGTGLQFTIHAEQCAIVNAAQHQEKAISTIAVNAAPCGFCRQFINELNDVNSVELIISGRKPENFQYYLPDPFSGRDLGVKTGMLNHPILNYQLQNDYSFDELYKIALASANSSYSPYSKYISGVAIKLRNGSIVGGSYYESAAFNPSISSIQSAIIRARLNGESLDEIEEVVLLQTKSNYCDYRKITAEILDSIAPDSILTIGSISKNST
jgi:cytidine deaminase